MPRSGPPPKLVCHLCGNEFGFQSLAIHQQRTCVRERVKAQAALPEEWRRRAPPGPDSERYPVPTKSRDPEVKFLRWVARRDGQSPFNVQVSLPIHLFSKFSSLAGITRKPGASTARRHATPPASAAAVLLAAVLPGCLSAQVPHRPASRQVARPSRAARRPVCCPATYLAGNHAGQPAASIVMLLNADGHVCL